MTDEQFNNGNIDWKVTVKDFLKSTSTVLNQDNENEEGFIWIIDEEVDMSNGGSWYE